MLLVLRRVGIVPRCHGVGVPDLPIPAVDSNLATSGVADDVFGAGLGFSLGTEMTAGSLGSRSLDVPPTVFVIEYLANDVAEAS